jgi:hypothetical protein
MNVANEMRPENFSGGGVSLGHDAFEASLQTSLAISLVSAELTVGREASLDKGGQRLRRRTMWLSIISSATMLLFAVPAFADSCLFSAAPRFQLSSDAVEWAMQIASGTTCTRGLKLGSTNITDVKLIAPPQSGKVDIKGCPCSKFNLARFRAGTISVPPRRSYAARRS